MEFLTGINPGLQMALYVHSTGILGHKHYDQVGIDDDRHLQWHAAIKVLTALANQLDHVNRSSIWQPRAHRRQSSQCSASNPPSPLELRGRGAGQAGTHIDSGQGTRRRSQTFRRVHEMLVVSWI